MEHSFNVEIAKEYGVNQAIILNHLYFWIIKNKANNKNFYDGYYWTYNSTKAFSELLPYMSERTINYALKKLINEGLIIVGNYNKQSYDRTLWYAITEKGYAILQNCEIHFTNLSNGFDEIVRPIPDNKPYIKKENILKEKSEKNFIKPTLEEVKQYCKERKNNIDAEYFIDFYESKGWKVGKNSMKSWKACIRTWEKNNKKGKSSEDEYIRV